MSDIVVTIAPNGAVKVEVNGCVGTDCQALTRGIEEALGKTTADQKKTEFYQTATTAQTVSQKG